MNITSALAVDVLRARIQASADTKLQILEDPELLETLGAAAVALATAVQEGRTTFFMGNGGSSTDAQHLAAELLGRFYRDRPALPAVCLSDCTAAVTAIANDYSYEEIFSRQLLGLAKAGDVAIGFSTSGNSKNVVLGLEAAKGQGLTTIAFTGAKGGAVADVAQYVFRAPSTDTPRIQECHLLVGHTLCEIVENYVYPT